MSTFFKAVGALDDRTSLKGFTLNLAVLACVAHLSWMLADGNH